MLIISQKTKKAKKIEFDPQLTIIEGDNDTGKSCLIRTIYYILGAETNQSKKWLEDKPFGLITFNLNDIEYSMLRNQKFFALFKNDKLINTFNSITNELAPFLANLFDFKIKLINYQNKSSFLPPAYLYLPFYIDQDKSWNKHSNSFLNLGQFSNWKKKLIEYLTGIKPNTYYESKNKINLIKNEIKNIESELFIQKKIRNRIKEKQNNIILTYDIDAFKKEINNLLEEISLIQKEAEKYKLEITNKYNYLDSLKIQKKIIEHQRIELNSDYEFATNKLDEIIQCPICGAEYSNNFSERFSIAQDENTCDELLIELSTKIRKEDLELQNLQKGLLDNNTRINKINILLQQKKENISLYEIIKQESNNSIKLELDNEIMQTENKIKDLNQSIEKFKKEIKKIENKKRVDDIKQYFYSEMEKNLLELDVHTLNENDYKKLESEIKESGSDLPRALLAYYFSIISTIFAKSETTRFPIIIDSPNQNAQDNIRLEKIYDFILNNKQSDRQIILGTENLLGSKIEGKYILLANKYNLLQKEEFEEVNSEINYYLKACNNI